MWMLWDVSGRIVGDLGVSCVSLTRVVMEVESLAVYSKSGLGGRLIGVDGHYGIS